MVPSPAAGPTIRPTDGPGGHGVRPNQGRVGAADQIVDPADSMRARGHRRSQVHCDWGGVGGVVKFVCVAPLTLDRAIQGVPGGKDEVISTIATHKVEARGRGRVDVERVRGTRGALEGAEAGEGERQRVLVSVVSLYVAAPRSQVLA